MKRSALIKTVLEEDISKSIFFKSQEFDPDPEILSIHYRSNDVRPGGLFVAISGSVADGHDYIESAVKNGAVVVIAQKPVECNVAVMEVKSSRKALALISAVFFGKPSKKLCVIGVTGTNGKTTTTFLVESILLKAGYKTGVIGTVNYRYSGKAFDNPMTTPESLDLQKILFEMAEAGVTHVVLEVSSHAVDLHRIYNCWLDIGVFTNLTQDHLDFHGDMETYWSCKKRLFTENLRLGPKKNNAVAVINFENNKGIELSKTVGDMKIFSAGLSKDCLIKASDIRADSSGVSGAVSSPAGVFNFRSSLVGTYNLENILCATGVGISLEIPLEIIRSGIELFQNVPGRLERVTNNIKRFVFVDYAHTPDALENVLSALKKVINGRLICVFGCGGDRDKTKRPKMGEIASQLADLCIITSDNPRTEDPDVIIDQIVNGLSFDSGMKYLPWELESGFLQKGYSIIPDRREAIQASIKASDSEDTILLAGKGHETYQILSTGTIPFDDRIEAETALEKFGKAI